MKRTPQPLQRRLREGIARLLCCGLVVLATGCAALGPWRRPSDVACRLPQNPTVAQVVEHVNANVAKVRCWRSDDIKIRANNAPLTFDGSLVVEREQRLRLQVMSMMGREVDFGSNDEVFWLWVKRSAGPGHEPAPLLFAHHADMDLARQKLPLPFEPPWLMEALGVAPLSADNVQMEGQPGVAVIKLVSQHQLSDGRRVRKVVAVDACKGHVLEHSVYDLHGRALVRTIMGTHKLDPASGAVLPRYIKLDWPQADMSLAMEFRSVTVNPPMVPETVWQMPEIPHTPVVNLGGSRPRTTPLALLPGQPRTSLLPPEAISPVSGNETFELPILNGAEQPVELQPPEEVSSEPAGRARLEPWLGGE